MIRTKAKSFILSIMLVMTCFVFFACKEKTEIKVENIAFTEQSISLLVGEDYTPNVKVLPSYATSRSYTLISSDTTALKIEGGTITALKASLDVKLKVVSDDNANINDVISVNIYDEASELVTPTELKFDGDKFTFLGKDNANAYMLKVDGQEINIGNNTEYAFNDVISKVNNVYDRVITCSVKAMGDGKIFKDSAYSEEISFVKLSNVGNAYVENETLYFNGIENVASYTVDILVNGNISEIRSVSNANFDASKLSLSLADLSDSVNGAEYTLRITPNIDNYNAQPIVGVFGGNSVDVNYAVLGVVQNLVVNDRVISWGFVKNAQSYTIEVYKDGSLLDIYENITQNYLQISYIEAGEYSCKVIANSTNANTTTGKNYSTPVNFNILQAPEIVIDNNSINWTNVHNAEGYLVTIKNNAGALLLNKSFVLYPTYDVSGFGAGTYNIEVVACGNSVNSDGVAILSSQASTSVSWTILQGLQLKVEGQKLYIQDVDTSSLNKYHLIFDDVDVMLTTSNLDYDSAINTFSYDLSTHNFATGTYTISVQSMGEGATFDAQINNTSIIKLPNSSITSLSNLKFTATQVANAGSYKIEIYSASDTQNAIITLDNMLSGNQFALDASTLQAGNYVAKVFVYGNGANVFDADNSDEGTTINFEKLAIPTISVDSENLKLQVSATKYNLFENSNNKNISGNEYDLSNLSAGDYTYTAQALGDNATVLNSDITLADNAIKVKKLATPTITFDKSTLAYTINCTDEATITELKYAFTLNDESVTVANNQADCSTLIANAGSYEAKVYAVAQVVAGYNLVIDSNIQTYSVSKLAGLCDFQVSNGSLIVTPNEVLSGTGYSLTLRIDNGESDIVLNNFTYTNSRFETNLYDNKYNVRNEIANILASAGEYTIFTTISQNKENVVTSSEIQCENTLKVLGKVTTIGKNAQTIEFNEVSNATNYIAVLKLNGVEYYIDLAGKYTQGTTNVLQVADLLTLMETKGVSYLEKTPYIISIVALNEDTRTIANKGINTYTFEFLTTPTISIIEQLDSNVKYLAIVNNDEDVVSYNVVISQESDIKNEAVAKQSGDNTLINMDELTQLVAGNVKIDVHSLVNSGDFFESKHSVLNIVKLDSATLTINNGVLEWSEITGAKQYNLVYSNSISNGTIVLTEGVDNFTIQNGKCIYNFDTLEAGTTRMYLQVDSQVKVGGTYYLNSNNGTMFENIYKLSTPVISVVNGYIYTELRTSEIDYIKTIEVKVNEEAQTINITQQQDGIVIVENGDKLCITIAPEKLLNYGTTELLKETLTLKLYSNNATTLNSSIGSKDIYGLLSPTGLDITTSTTTTSTSEGKDVIEEIFEKITWNNPSANGEYVVKYEIIINYNSSNYIFESTERIFMMPTYYDEDGDGSQDEGEIEFGAGVYTIKVKALTDDSIQYVNSKYCDEITVTILETPTSLATKDGNIIWQNNESAGYYLIKVYLLKNGTQTLLDSSNASLNEFDLTTLKPFDTGVYGISVQAMHDSSRILASKESEIFQVVRLPQVAEYYVKNGELYIRIHSFYSRAEVYLTGATTHTFTIVNAESNNNIINYVKNGLYMTWASSNIIDTYKNDDYYIDVKYEVEDDSTLRMALAGDYSISVKLFGNTLSSEVSAMLPKGASIGAIISGHTSEQAINTYWKDDDTVANKNVIEKLVTPNIEVSSTERGVVLLNLPKGVTYSLNYYIDGKNSLQGVHLYEVNIATSDKYTIYVAEIVDEAKLLASLTAVGSELIKDNADRNNLKHFEYNGITFNVIEANSEGYIPFNFNVAHYYYYTSSGDYQYIDLTIGGSFVFNVRFLGDDSIFVQSNMTDIVTVKRYNILNLSINNGNLSWLNQATADDHPIYLITLTNEAETYYLVLYNPNVYASENELLACLDSSKTYIFDTITYSLDENVTDEVITYTGLADIIDKARAQSGSSSLIGLGGTFLATIKAHYTDNTSMDIILAQGGESKTLAVLPQAQISIVDGTLNWNMSYVTNTSGKEYIVKYLLQIFDGDNELYEITLNSGDYSVINNVATYQLPKVLNNTNDGEFTFSANSNYTFNLTALGGDGKTYVNSVATTTGEITILPELQDVRMENGVLTWTNTTSNSVEVYVTYTLGDATVTFIVLETDNIFELPASYTDTNQTLRQLISGYDYHIKVRLRGSSTTLNSFFSNEIVAQRVATVASSSVVTNKGVLTWASDSLAGVKYTIVYTLEDGTTGETELIDTNSFDFNGFGSGVITAQVYAHHNNHFSSFVSESVTLFKLDVPTNIKYHEGSTTISWDKVVDASGNPVDNYMVSIMEEGKGLAEYVCTTNEWIITDVSSNAFSIAVKAISVETSGTVINSNYSSYQSMELPHQVDATTFMFDEELQAFKWKAIEGEQEGDKYYIGYNYYDTILSSEINADITQVAYEQVTQTREIDGEKYYYYYPSMVGSYRLIYVQVVRAESLSSQQTYCMNGNDYYELNFDLFSSGDGTSSNPYIISNERHLRNIKYFLDANYELDSNITLTSNTPITNSTQVFTGTINGNDRYISGINTSTMATFDESGYVGLFNKVSNATFANITLTNFALSGYLNSATLYMGVLAGYADNESTFINVTIISSTITLTKSNTNGYTDDSVDMYVGAIVGYANNCTFTSCVINLGGTTANIIADIEGNSQTKLTIGGVTGYANNCKLTNNTSNGGNAFIVSTILTITGGTPIVYIGALVGESSGSNVTLSGNSCSYSESSTQGLTSKTNEIGN